MHAVKLTLENSEFKELEARSGVFGIPVATLARAMFREGRNMVKHPVTSPIPSKSTAKAVRKSSSKSKVKR